MGEKMKKITILLSSYNGGTYLAEQLESIYKQRGLDGFSVEIICRDDGSSDNTLDVLNEWKDKLNITIAAEKNIGARESFFKLLREAPESDYYAFCDQDDVWHEDKLIRAIEMIKGNRTLYFSNIEYVDEDGMPLHRNLLDSDFIFSLKRLLICNPANGCSMVWDKEMQLVLKQIPYDTFTMHDEYLATVAALFGNVVYDSIPSMGYRLHNQNVTQSNSLKKKFKLWRAIWFGRKEYSLDKRAEILLNYELKDEDRTILYEISNYKRGLNRFRVLKKYSCENRRIERSFRLRMLIGVL